MDEKNVRSRRRTEPVLSCVRRILKMFYSPHVGKHTTPTTCGGGQRARVRASVPTCMMASLALEQYFSSSATITRSPAAESMSHSPETSWSVSNDAVASTYGGASYSI